MSWSVGELVENHALIEEREREREREERGGRTRLEGGTERERERDAFVVLGSVSEYIPL